MATREVIYLDNAATSWPKPKCVLEAMSKFMLKQGGSPNRAGHRMSAIAGRIVQDTRVKLARLFNVGDPSRIVHCFNCTDALNIALKGVLREGDHVICSDVDHNSILRPLQAMANAGQITFTRLSLTDRGQLDPDAVRHAITPKTRLIATVHASNVTGRIQPVAQIGEIARQHDLCFLLDAAQSVGVLDVDVEALNVDLLAFPGHKSLQGPTGTGGLYVGPRASLRPFREGGTGADSIAPTQPTEFPTWLEAGTPNTVGLAGLSAALDELAPEKTLEHERRIIGRLADALVDNSAISMLGDWSAEDCVAVLAFRLEGLGVAELAAILDESFYIAVRPGLHCAPFMHRMLGTFPDGTVRVSPGWSTTDEQIDALALALREITRG